MLRLMAPLPNELVLQHVRAALAEDIGNGDATTLATVPQHASANAAMVAREDLVVCGLQLAAAAFQEVAAATRVRNLVSDGGRLRAGERILEVEGPARAVLTAERVALNFVQRLSGVAIDGGTICRGGCRDQGHDSRYAENHSGLAQAGEIRRALRRGTEPSLRPLGHGAHQRQSSRRVARGETECHCRSGATRSRKISRAQS